MTIRTSNKQLLNKLVEDLGPRELARLEIGADVSRSTLVNMMKGAVPSEKILERVATFLGRSVDELFPFLEATEKAA